MKNLPTLVGELRSKTKDYLGENQPLKRTREKKCGHLMFVDWLVSQALVAALKTFRTSSVPSPSLPGRMLPLISAYISPLRDPTQQS